MTTLARLMVKVGVDNDDVDKGIARTRASFAKMRKHMDDDGNKTGSRFANAFASSMKKTLTPSITAIATGLSAQLTGALVAGLASGVGKAVHGMGAALALLPSIALAAGVALSTVKLAMHGVGDALKAGLAGDTEKYAEAMAKLAPSARVVVREIVAAKGAFEQMRKTVQGNLFGPLEGAVTRLARIGLPLLTDVLGRVAAHMGLALKQIVGFVTTPAVFSGLALALRYVGAAVSNLVAGVPNLVRAFLPLVRVGASFLPGLTIGFEGATARLAAFMEQAERTGRLAAFIQGGIDKLKSLWETAKQVGRIFENLAEAASIAFSRVGLPAGTLLDTIETLTEKLTAFMGTAKGKNLVAQLMGTAGRLAEAFFGTLQKVGEVLAPILPQVGEFFAAFLKFKFAALDALAPIVRLIGEHLLPVLTGLLTWAAETKPVMIGFLTLMAAKWAYSGAQAVLAAGKTTAAFATTMAHAVTATAKIVAQIALQVAQWVVLGVQSMIHAAKVAAAWLISMGPIGLIIAAVVGLVAVIIANWDTIVRVISGAARAVLDFLKRNWPLILAIIAGPLGLIILTIVKHWDTIWSVTTGVFGAIVNFIGSVVGAIGRALGAIPGFVWNMIQSVANFVGRIPGMVGGALSAVASIIYNAMKAGFDGLVSLVKWWINTVIWLLGSLPSMAWNAIKGLGDVIWSVIKSAVNGAIGLINYIIELWNNFSIGMSWGGFNPPGPGSIPGFSFELKTPNISKIPKLAEGGIATSATLGIFGEAGPEAIIPLDKLGDIMGSMPAGSGEGNVVTFDFRGADSELGRALKKMVRVKGRGNAEVYFA